MGLRGDHLVTLFKHCNATPVRRGVSTPVFTLAGRSGSILWFFMALFLAPGLLQPVPAAVPGPAASPQPLLQTHFSDPPEEDYWQGDLPFFRTEPGHDPGMLRLAAPPDLGTAYISTRHSYHAVHWEWYMRQSFAPSNNNRAFVFLNESSGLLGDQPTGLAIRSGENGTPKHFRLLHFDRGTASPELIRSDMEIQPDAGYRIRVLLTPDQKLHLYIADDRYRTPLLQSETAAWPESMDIDGHFGFLARYTATRSDQFFFSDVWIADFLPEPGITGFSVSPARNPSASSPHPWPHSDSGTIITVTFEVPPDPDALDVRLFRLQSGSHPDEIHCGHPQVCSLMFRDTLPSGKQQLVTESYQTIYGQHSEQETHDFLVAAEVSPGDVVINEFMYRPPAGVPAYVELYNRSDKLLNLRNWRLQRRAVSTEPERIITGDDFFLHPGSYLALTPDATRMQNFPGAAHILEMESFPRFNIASSDEIRLFSDAGMVIDSLQYVPSTWGGFEVALERKSPDAPGWIPENWGESLSDNGGTPGLPNTVRPPDTPPELVHLDYSQPSVMLLTFSRRLDPSSLDYSNAIQLLDSGDILKSGHIQYAGSQGTYREIPVTVTPAGEKEVRVMPSEELHHGVRYLVRISHIRDIFGNSIHPVEKGFRYFDIAQPEPRDVIINEVLYRPGQNHRRFIEILNRSERVFDLRGWKVGRSLGAPTVITDDHSPDPVILIPGEMAVISEPGFTVAGSDAMHFEIPAFPSLSRFGDSVFLISDNSIVADSLAYQPSWGGNRDGVSLERIDPEGATNDPANWNEHPDSHTAGMENHHYDAYPGPVSLVRASRVNGTHVELTFNRHVILSTLTDVAMNHNPLIPVATENTPGHESVYLFRSDEAIERQFQTVHIGSVRDYAGRESTGLSSPLTFPPHSGDIIINEVMYQPIAERYSRRPDQGEYVEVYNRSGLPLQMDQVYLHDRPDKNGGTRKLHPVDSGLATLKPERYAVFYADTSSAFQNSRLSRAFPESDPRQALFFRIDRQTLGLSTQGDEIYVADEDYGVLDSLWYHPSWHSPNLPDVRGISLERINFVLPTGDRANWTSSTSPDGGTPGYPNSAMAPAGAAENPGLKLAPNPFSPNGDGMYDHLIIHYQLDGPDYLVHARVFDRQGRRVRTLANGMAAGRSGKLIWDGRTDRGIMNRAGIYIIHLEAYHSSQNQRRSYRAVAVLAFPL